MSIFDKLSNFLPSRQKKVQAEYYFALNIEEGMVVGSVWGVEEHRFKIISVAKEKYYPEEEVTEKHPDLVLAANIALDNALADFQPEPAKILFGVPDSYLQDEDLKEDKARILKRLVKELDVVPMAFVSSTHAICHLLQKQEGVPITAVMVGITDPLVVTVVKAGKVVASKTQKRTANLPQDIEKALLMITEIEVLPSKILIYGEEEMNKYKEELISFNWMAQLPFLHVPKIEELEEDFSIKAISFAGASELSPDIKLHSSDLRIGEKKEAMRKGMLSIPFSHSDNLETGHTGKLDEAGGFVSGDIKEIEDQGLETAVETNHLSHPTHYSHEELAQKHNQSLMSTVTSAVAAPLDAVAKVGSSFSDGLLAGSFIKLLIIPLILILFVIGAYVFFPKAKVTVFVDPKVLEKETQVVADPTVTAVDEANKKIPGQIIETTVDGTAKGVASGKKKVGDPAKGTAIIYNKTSSSKSLPSGTVLIGPDNLEFTLDSAVNIASQSAVEGGISFGKATVSVTASAIGPESNLSAGRDLTIKGAGADYTAKADTAFSGGVSKDVTVVTDEDQKKLLASLSSDLRKKARDELQVKLTENGDLKVLEEALSEKIVSQSFSKKVGDQAADFSLTLKNNLKGTAYKDSDLKTIVSKLVVTNVPDGYSLDLGNTETQANVSKLEKDGRIVFLAKFRAKLMPRLDSDKIKSEITFKTPQEVENILKGYENVIGADISISPSLPGPLQRLPIMAKNITLDITAK